MLYTTYPNENHSFELKSGFEYEPNLDFNCDCNSTQYFVQQDEEWGDTVPSQVTNRIVNFKTINYII